MTLAARIGAFLLFIGFLAMVLFIAGFQADVLQLSWLCIGSILLILGVYLIWKYRSPPPPSGRFSTYKKITRRGKEGRAKAEEE